MTKEVWIEVIGVSGRVHKANVQDRVTNRRLGEHRTRGLELAAFGPARDWLVTRWAYSDERPFDHTVAYIPVLRGVWDMGGLIVVEIGPTTVSRRPLDFTPKYFELPDDIARAFLRTAELVDVEL
jgi:hypothetical protein